MRNCCVYIMASRSKTIYIGVTSNLAERVQQHKAKKHRGFTASYNVDRLVYWEELPDISAAIAREKALKGWKRERKVRLIEESNPSWEDLAPGPPPHDWQRHPEGA
jgi:putative endonuclease